MGIDEGMNIIIIKSNPIKAVVQHLFNTSLMNMNLVMKNLQKNLV